mmetsp:Transcript_32149/g.58914  ORF Transcript_32149/g.58914 Transcript_32149/m.58914 type:complete len:200 (+) Transcript_32149:973-1572(+)
MRRSLLSHIPQKTHHHLSILRVPLRTRLPRGRHNLNRLRPQGMPKKGRRSRRLLRPRQTPPSLHGQILRRNRVGARNPYRTIQQDRGGIERHRNRLGSRRRGGMRRAALPTRGSGGGAAAHRIVGVRRRGDRRADGRCGREVLQRAGSVGGEDGGVARDGAFAFENYRGVGVRIVEECECEPFRGGVFRGSKRRRSGGQ